MAGNWVSVSRVTGGDAHHYITEELRYYIVYVPFFTKFSKVFPNEILSQKKCIPLLGGELNPVSGVAGGDAHHYTIEELHAQNSLWTVFHQMRFWIKSWSKKDHSSPRRGIEFRSPTRQAGILSIILPRYYVFRSFAHRFSASFQRCLQRNPEVKNFILLLGGELSFGLPRDRQGCSPLYYWGTTFLDRLPTHFSYSFQRCFQIKSWTKRSVFISSAGNWTRSLALQAGMLITILSRNYMLRILCGPSFTKCGFE